MRRLALPLLALATLVAAGSSTLPAQLRLQPVAALSGDTQLELILPHAQRAFDLLVEHVEHRAPLPGDQCIPRGGSISAAPSQPGHCRNLFEP